MSSPRTPDSDGPGGSAPGAAAESPSFAAEDADAFEMKFLLDEEQARKVEAWARTHMSCDPHGDPALAGGYKVSTLYLDTPRLDVFHGARELAGTKWRVRRYGDDGAVFLERKQRRGERVRKWRSRTRAQDWERAQAHHTEADDAGGWFQDEIAARELRPACRISYLRTAFYHPTDPSHMRLTLDRAIRCAPAAGWSVEPVPTGGAVSLADGRVVCELKFRDAMPRPFRELLATTGLTPGAFSKYRRACVGTGLVHSAEGNDA